MKRLILIRHAQSEHHLRQMTGGWTDLPLTDHGRQQSLALARRLSKDLHDTDLRLFSSDLRRSAQTAEAIAARLAVPIEWEPRLRELNNGQAAGLTLEAAAEICLPETRPTVDWVPYPGAESWQMMADRLMNCLNNIALRCPDTAVLVTHANAGVVVIHWWLRLCPICQRQVAFELEPASVTDLVINEWGERTIRRANDTAHLLGL